MVFPLIQSVFLVLWLSSGNGANGAVAQRSLTRFIILMYTRKETSLPAVVCPLETARYPVKREHAAGPRSEELSVKKSSASRSLNVEPYKSFEIIDFYNRLRIHMRELTTILEDGIIRGQMLSS